MTSTSSCSSSKRTRVEDELAARQRVEGEQDCSTAHEVTRYLWWDSHEGSTIQVDRCFKTRRMALLYCAKLNADAFSAFADASGKSWEAFFGVEGSSYALLPNRPFELESFLELTDDALSEYSDGVCNAFSRHKVPKGVSYRYSPREMHVVDCDELLKLLRLAPGAQSHEHLKRQALLLSDIAGFD